MQRQENPLLDLSLPNQIDRSNGLDLRSDYVSLSHCNEFKMI